MLLLTTLPVGQLSAFCILFPIQGKKKEEKRAKEKKKKGNFCHLEHHPSCRFACSHLGNTRIKFACATLIQPPRAHAL